MTKELLGLNLNLKNLKPRCAAALQFVCSEVLLKPRILRGLGWTVFVVVVLLFVVCCCFKIHIRSSTYVAGR